MSPAAQQTQLFARVLAASHSDSISTGICGEYPWNSWLQELAQHRHTSDTSNAAIRALSLSHLARDKADGMLFIVSRQEYSKALRGLNAMLQTREKACTLDPLITTVLLSFFEIQNCTTDQRSWNQHAAAVSRLLLLRGAEAHREGLARSTLRAFRSSIILYCMQTRQACFLESSTWRDVLNDDSMQTDHNSVQSAIELFMRELARHPSFYAAMKRNGSAIDPAICQKLLEMGEELLDSFKSAQSRIAYALLANGLSPNIVISQREDSLFPAVIRFPNSYIGSLYCGFVCERMDGRAPRPFALLTVT